MSLGSEAAEAMALDIAFNNLEQARALYAASIDTLARVGLTTLAEELARTEPMIGTDQWIIRDNRKCWRCDERMGNHPAECEV